jgi:hypothetical protein
MEQPPDRLCFVSCNRGDQQMMMIINRSPFECMPEASFDALVDELLQICTIDGRVNPFEAHYQFMEPIG